MISHKAIVAVAALATASLWTVYYGLAGKTHSPSLSSYVVVDTQGQRIAALLDASRPPSAEQLAVFKKYSPVFWKNPERILLAKPRRAAVSVDKTNDTTIVPRQHDRPCSRQLRLFLLY